VVSGFIPGAIGSSSRCVVNPTWNPMQVFTGSSVMSFSLTILSSWLSSSFVSLTSL